MTTRVQEDVDWIALAKEAFGSAVIGGIVGASLNLIAIWARAQQQREEEGVDDEPDVEAIEAAELLGIDVDASADAIRAALRRKMTEERAHPDQGGDPKRATELVAAKNLLIERANEKED